MVFLWIGISRDEFLMLKNSKKKVKSKEFFLQPSKNLDFIVIVLYILTNEKVQPLLNELLFRCPDSAAKGISSCRAVVPPNRMG